MAIIFDKTPTVGETKTVGGKTWVFNGTGWVIDASAGGTTSQYWRGDKTWRDFATDVRGAVLTGLSTATSAVISATDTVLSALGKLQGQITDNRIPPGYIDGLKMVWVSGTALTVTTGAAYIQGSSKVLRATSDIVKTGLSLTASTWYHVYLYDNAGTPDFELSTTAPAAPYNGTARTKTGDTSRRYIGSVKAGTGGLYNFLISNNSVIYRESVADGEFRVVGGGVATVETSASCAPVVPGSARMAILRLITTSTSGGTLRTGTSDDSIAGGGGGGYGFAIAGGAPSTQLHPLDSSGAFTYWFTAAPVGGGAYINVLGYQYER